MFVVYLKIINTFFEKMIHENKLFKELKNAMEILVGQEIFKLWIKTVKILFW